MSTTISKAYAISVMKTLLMDYSGMSDESAQERAEEMTISGKRLAKDYYLIKTESDNFGIVFDLVLFKNDRVEKYQSLQLRGRTYFKFSDDSKKQYTEKVVL